MILEILHVIRNVATVTQVWQEAPLSKKTFQSASAQPGVRALVVH